MTIKEAVFANCAVLVDPGAVDLEIINAGFDGSTEYAASMKRDVAKISCEVLNATLSLSSIKEGDLTVNYNFAGIKARLSHLSQLHGFTEFDSQSPTISSPKPW